MTLYFAIGLALHVLHASVRVRQEPRLSALEWALTTVMFVTVWPAVLLFMAWQFQAGFRRGLSTHGDSDA